MTPPGLSSGKRYWRYCTDIMIALTSCAVGSATIMRAPPCRMMCGADREALEKAFRKTVAAEKTFADTAPLYLPGLYSDLPLWRVQWPALPGFNQILHVHVPHYVHMFESLATTALEPKGGSFTDPSWGPWGQLLCDEADEAEPKNAPAVLEAHEAATPSDDDEGVEQLADGLRFGARGPLFGHLLLEGGSAALGKPEARLVKDGTAPTIGALMRLRELRRLGDGRLAVHAVAVGRFRVLRATQDGPYSRADVAVLPDREEVMAWIRTSSRFHGDRTPAIRLAGARAAAAAWSMAWSEHEYGRRGRTKRAAGDGEAAEEEEEGLDSGLGELARFNLELDEAVCAAEASAAGEAAAWHGGGAAATAAFESVDLLGGGAGGGEFSEEGEGVNPFSDPAWGPWGSLLGGGEGDGAQRGVGAEWEEEADGEEEEEEEEEEAGGGGFGSSGGDAATTRRQRRAEERMQEEREAELAAAVDLTVAPPGGVTTALERAEQLVWIEVISCLLLTRTLRRRQSAAPPSPEQAQEEEEPTEDDSWWTLVEKAEPTAEQAEEGAAAGGAEAKDRPVEPVAVPEELRVLMPPAPPDGWPAGAPAPPQRAATEELPSGYPPLRRAQRLSFLVAALLPELDRQQLLACGGVAERLEDVLLHLRATRERLAALAALRELE